MRSDEQRRALIFLAERAQTLSYDTIARAVGLRLHEVELFLVEALLDGTVKGVVDAQSQSLVLSGCASGVLPASEHVAAEIAQAMLARIDALTGRTGALNDRALGSQKPFLKRTFNQSESTS